jgi:DNA-binding response OmpR family regulator
MHTRQVVVAMLTISVVEDNDDLRISVVNALLEQNFNTLGFDCAEAFIERTVAPRVDLVIVDSHLPGESGITLTNRMRCAQPDIGIIMLIEANRTLDRQIGYSCGADICLTQPGSLGEMSAAVKSLLRRVRPQKKAVQSLFLDLERQVLIGLENDVDLSKIDTQLLIAFIMAPEHSLETWQIAEQLALADEFPSRNAINVAIFRFKTKISSAYSRSKPAITVIRNWGYRLNVDIRIGS